MQDRSSLPDPERAAPPSTVTRAVREWLPLGLLLALLAVVVRYVARPLGNTDTYFHLRFGEEFLDGSWSLRDPGSVSSFATSDWVPTQWLAQVTMARVEGWWGLAGVAWLAGVLVLAVAMTFYAVARRRADRLAAVVVSIVAVVACAPSLSARPQVVSYLLTAVYVGWWLRARDRRRVPWPLVPLTWLWAMCHGMWPVGVVVGLVAAVGVVLDTGASRREALRWFAVPAASLLAAGLLTPVGPALLPAVLTVSSRGDYFAEWSPADFTDPTNVALVALAVITLLAMLRRPRPWTEVLLVLLACGWALWSARGVPVSAAMLVPLGAAALQPLIGPRSPVRRAERVVAVGGLLAAVAVLAVLAPRTSDEPMDRPTWLDAELAALPAGTPVLNDWGWGGFLMWRYPQLDLVMHGYGDTFTTAELDRNVDILDLEPGWDDLVRGTGARIALLEADSPLGYALEQAAWEVREEDDDLVLLEAPAGW